MSFLYDVRGTVCNLTSAFATHVFHLASFYQSLLTLLLRSAGESALKVFCYKLFPPWKCLLRVFLCHCVGPIPLEEGLTLDRKLALHITIQYSN